MRARKTARGKPRAAPRRRPLQPRRPRRRRDAGTVPGRDANGTTTLMHAAAYEPDPHTIRSLLAAGERLEERDRDGVTALMYAAALNPHPRVLARLLEAGARVNDRGKDGLTPLMYAAESNTNPRIVEALLAAGADPTLHSEEGKSAYDYAMENDAMRSTTQLAALKRALLPGARPAEPDSRP